MLIQNALNLLNSKSNIIKNGLVLWLDGQDFLNNPITSSWRDRSNNGNNALPTGLAYTTISGADTQGGVIFDGIDDYFEIGDKLNFGTSDFTMCIKFKQSISPNIYSPLIMKRENLTSTEQGWSIKAKGSNGLEVYINGESAIQSALPVDTCINVSTLFVVRKSGIITVKQNLLSITRTNTNEEALTVDSTSTLKIAKGGIDEFAKATIYATLVYNRALTDIEIEQNYNCLN